MAPLQNSFVEKPEKVFEVTLVVFGTLTRSAFTRTIKVFAQTSKGAKKICQSRYRRSEITSAKEVVEARRYAEQNLFASAEF